MPQHLRRCLWQAGWSYGYVSASDSQERTIWIVDAHRDDGRRFVVRADEKLTAFLELEGRWPSRKRGFDRARRGARWAALLLCVPETPLRSE
jgi:hypothetical protein